MRALRGAWAAILDNGMLIVLGALAYAVALDHVIDVATWAGQLGWKSWAIGASVEMLALAAIREIYVRIGRGVSWAWPAFCLLLGGAMSMACNLQASGPDALTAPPGMWVQVMAVWPVVCALAVAGCKATRAHPPQHAIEPAPADTAEPTQPPPAQVPAPTGDGGADPAQEFAPPPDAGAEDEQDTTDDIDYPSKRAHLLALVSKVPADDPRTNAELARDLAPRIDLNEGTARRYINESGRPAQSDQEPAGAIS